MPRKIPRKALIEIADRFGNRDLIGLCRSCQARLDRASGGAIIHDVNKYRQSPFIFR